MPPDNPPEPITYDVRLKQLDFLRQMSEAHVARAISIAKMLIIGNAGVIATCSIILKDLNTRFSATWILIAATIGAFGLISSGVFNFFCTTAYNSYQQKLREFLFNNEQVQELEKIDVDDAVAIGVAFVVSIASLGIAILVILLSMLR